MSVVEGWKPTFSMLVIIVGVIANILATLQTGICEVTRQNRTQRSCYYAERVYQLVLSVLLLILAVVMFLLGTSLNAERQKRYVDIKKAIGHMIAETDSTSPQSVENKLHSTLLRWLRLLSSISAVSKFIIWLRHLQRRRSPNRHVTVSSVVTTISNSTVETFPDSTEEKHPRRSSDYAVVQAMRPPIKHSLSSPALLNGTSLDVNDVFLEALSDDLRKLSFRKVSSHQMRIGYILAVATAVGYLYKFLVVLMFRACKDELHYENDSMEVASDTCYYLACTVFYAVLCYWIKVMRYVPLKDTNSRGIGLLSTLLSAVLLLVFIKVNAREGLVVFHHLSEATNYTSSEDTDVCNSGKRVYLDVIDERVISPAIYLFEAEAIPVLYVLLRAIKSCHAHNEVLGNNLVAMRNSVGKPMQIFATAQAVMLVLASLTNIYRQVDYISDSSDELNNYAAYTLSSCIRQCFQLMVLATMYFYVRVDNKVYHSPAYQGHRQHARLDAVLLFIALAPIYILTTAAVISQGAEWHLIPRQDIDLFNFLDNVLVGVVYTAQYFCFRRLMYCTHENLLVQRGVVLPGILGIMVCSILRWFSTFLERMFIARVFMSGRAYYSAALWTAIVAGTYPGLAFINFHTAICCFVLIQRKRETHHARRREFEISLAKHNHVALKNFEAV